MSASSRRGPASNPPSSTSTSPRRRGCRAATTDRTSARLPAACLGLWLCLFAATAARADGHREAWDRLVREASSALEAGEPARAEELLRQSLERLGTGDAEELARATSLNNLGFVLFRQKRFEEAREAYREALAVRERLLGPEDPSVAQILNNLGELERAVGDREKALALHRRALAIREATRGPDHPETAQSLIACAVAATELGRLDEARAFATRAVTALERAYGEEHVRVADALAALAAVASRQGRLEEAEELYRRAVALHERAAEPDREALRTILVQLAEVLRRDGRSADAVPLLEEAASLAEPELAPWAPGRERARIHNDLGVNLYETGEFERARRALEQAVELYDASADAPREETVAPLVNLAAVLSALQENEAAIDVLQKAIARLGGLPGDHDAELARLWNDLGALQFTLGHYREAAESLARAVELGEAALGADSPDLAVYLRNRATALSELGETEEAQALLARADAIGKPPANGAAGP